MCALEQLVAAIDRLARQEGFHRLAVAPAGAVEDPETFLRWLHRGCHASMEYLERNANLRQSADRLFEGAQSVLCLATGYAPFRSTPPNPALPAGAFGGQGECDAPQPASAASTASAVQTAARDELVARYARGRDYHKVLKGRCIRLMDRIREIEPTFQGRAFVDTAPLAERSLAARSGLGWIGDNGCLFVPGLGSYVVLAEIVCNLPLPPGEPLIDGCDHCGRCSAACPTSAILPDGLVDCRRCISYLTIENRGLIEGQYWRRVGRRVFGCDACQEACPHNQDIACGDAELAGTGRVLQGAGLAEMLAWTYDDWDRATRGSATRRATYEMFLRNAIIAAGNSGDSSLIQPLRALSQADTYDTELIHWALERLSEEEE